jgi:hypothetical protein
MTCRKADLYEIIVFSIRLAVVLVDVEQRVLARLRIFHTTLLSEARLFPDPLLEFGHVLCESS